MTSKKILITVLFAFVFILIPSASVFAICGTSSIDSLTGKLCYVKLEPNAFPGVTNSTDLGTFLGSVFDFGIAGAIALTLIMIIWGGIMYMTTDAWAKKEEGKAKIISALEGLGIALISWLLLYTINPDLVDFSKNTLLNPNKTAITPISQQQSTLSIPTFSDTYNSQTNTSEMPGTCAGTKQCVINNAPVQIPSNKTCPAGKTYNYSSNICTSY